MKFKGKSAFWFWGVFILVNAVFLQDIFLAESAPALKIVSLIIFNIIYLPMIFRNYVKIENDMLIVAFGFGKNAMKISDIVEVTMMLNPTGAGAAQDRIMVKGKEDELIFSVKHKEELLDELKMRNPEIAIRKG